MLDERYRPSRGVNDEADPLPVVDEPEALRSVAGS